MYTTKTVADPDLLCNRTSVIYLKINIAIRIIVIYLYMYIYLLTEETKPLSLYGTEWPPKK